MVAVHFTSIPQYLAHEMPYVCEICPCTNITYAKFEVFKTFIFALLLAFLGVFVRYEL